MSTPAVSAGRQRLIGHITACWRTQVVTAAVQLDLIEHMAAGCCDAGLLAAACGCSADGLLRLLRALCTLGICRQSEERFELAPEGFALCRVPPDGGPSLRALARWWGGPMWATWEDLEYSVRTGLSARQRRTGLADYAFLDGHPDAASLFHDAMRAMTALIAEEVACLPVWEGALRFVDVGGGHGEMAAAVAAAHEMLHVCVLDRADAQSGANALFSQRGIATRASFVCGDFFHSVPPGADRYLLKSILHNWGDEACARILRRCADAAPPGAVLLVVERLRPFRLQSSAHDRALARTDLNMLAGLGGRERSLEEFRALLADAGFDAGEVTATSYEFSVLHARRK